MWHRLGQLYLTYAGRMSVLQFPWRLVLADLSRSQKILSHTNSLSNGSSSLFASILFCIASSITLIKWFISVLFIETFMHYRLRRRSHTQSTCRYVLFVYVSFTWFLFISHYFTLFDRLLDQPTSSRHSFGHKSFLHAIVSAFFLSFFVQRGLVSFSLVFLSH